MESISGITYGPAENDEQFRLNRVFNAEEATFRIVFDGEGQANLDNNMKTKEPVKPATKPIPKESIHVISEEPGLFNAVA